MKPGHRAFTLIELLTVIAVIGILAAIIIGTAGPVREKANQVRCLNNLRELGVMISLYENDNRGVIPSGLDGNGLAWDVKLGISTQGGLQGPAGNINIIACPSDRVERPANTKARSYSLNDRSYDLALGYNPSGSIRRTNLARPSQTILLSEWHIASNIAGNPGWSVAGDLGLNNFNFKWHGGGASGNVLWFDGHVSSLQSAGADQKFFEY